MSRSEKPPSSLGKHHFNVRPNWDERRTLRRSYVSERFFIFGGIQIIGRKAGILFLRRCEHGLYD
jgi:hypothetical protein